MNVDICYFAIGISFFRKSRSTYIKYICENISKEGRDINTAIYYKLNIVYGLFVLSLFTVALRLFGKVL
jgi:hypothetical protein